MTRIGPLLTSAMSKVAVAEGFHAAMEVAADFGPSEAPGALPVYLGVPRVPASPHLSWAEYRERVSARLAPIREELRLTMGVEARPLYCGNALQAELTPEQVERLAGSSFEIEVIELDPLVQVVTMDDVIGDVGQPAFAVSHPGVDGSGVVVAVLDSGVDRHHPFLNVTAAFTTTDESVDLPGSHGTHCAGSIASTDAVYPGVAPGVTLLDVKVLRANGTGTSTWIAGGVDVALDNGAEILSMSLGFNHLPTWSDRGHGWSCPDGRCPLCTAVDNAVTLDNAIVVVAAGNDHARAVNLRAAGHGALFDTELGCPGQARKALTVGAITKSSHQIAGFSSHGPTAYQVTKPDLVAPGVNVTSTIPVPRDAHNQPIPSPKRSELFGRKSGTSMATPIAAASAALLLQRRRASSLPTDPSSVVQDLLAKGVTALTGLGVNVAGAGRLDLTGL